MSAYLLIQTSIRFLTLIPVISNPNGKVVVGDRVWIYAHSMILRNSYIPNGAIIGAGSIVNKCFKEENTLIVGNLAKVKRNGITLARDERGIPIR